MTELWAKNACPYMGARTIFDYNSALKWANFNIFAWNLFYMMHRHETHNCKVRSWLADVVRQWYTTYIKGILIHVKTVLFSTRETFMLQLNCIFICQSLKLLQDVSVECYHISIHIFENIIPGGPHSLSYNRESLRNWLCNWLRNWLQNWLGCRPLQCFPNRSQYL